LRIVRFSGSALTVGVEKHAIQRVSSRGFEGATRSVQPRSDPLCAGGRCRPQRLRCLVDPDVSKGRAANTDFFSVKFADTNCRGMYNREGKIDQWGVGGHGQE